MERVEMDRNSHAGPGWTFDWSFNIGHVLAIVTVIGGCSSTYFGIKSEIQDQGKETAYLTTRVTLIEKDRSEKIPRLEEQVRLNGLQDQRIQNLTEALASLRMTVTDLTRIVAAQSDLLHDADKRTAILEERLGRVTPHDR